MAPVFEYEPDKEGRRILYVRVKMHRKIPQLEERFKRSFVNFVETCDMAANCEFGWSVVFDMTASGYANADLEMLFFVMPTIRRCYPNGVKHVLVCGLPWILNSVAKFALAFMPADTAKKIKFVTQEELQEYIPVNHLPDFVGGTCQRNYRVIPKGAKTCTQLGKELYDLNEDQVKKLLRPSMKFVAEGQPTAQYETT